MFWCRKNKFNRNVRKKLTIFNCSFICGKASFSSNSTVGVPNYFSTFKLSDGSISNVTILDTAGEEKFRALNSSYYKKADCCLLVYDITRGYTFDEIKNYFNHDIKEKCKKNIKIIILGNKTDIEDQREVSSEEGAGFALENDYIFMETSCLKNAHVADAFETLIEITSIELKKNKVKDDKILLNNNNYKKKKKKKNVFC